MDQTAPKGPNLSEIFSPARKERARAWFEHLRDQICTALEAIEDEADVGHIFYGSITDSSTDSYAGKDSDYMTGTLAVRQLRGPGS